MKNLAILLVLLLGLLVGFAAATLAGDAERKIFGAIPSHDLVEKFRMTVGITTGGRPARDQELLQAREQLNLPDFYGELVAVTGDGDLAVLWYRDANGLVRNVIVEKPATASYAITPTKTTDFSIDSYR